MRLYMKLTYLRRIARVTGYAIVLWLGVQKIISYDLMPPDRPLARRIIQTEQAIMSIPALLSQEFSYW